MQTTQLDPLYIALTVLIMGGFSIGFAAAAIAHRYWILPVLAVLEGVVFALLKSRFRPTASLVEAESVLKSQLAWIGLGAILSVVLGYILFIHFFSRQGARFFRVQNEIAMASEIHRALVPPIHKTIGSFEIFGASVPSGEVGGDLVDVAADGENWTGYVADVSGHGVSAGLLMAMFKTAVRTSANGASSAKLLENVHRALYPLKTPNMFATVGVLHCTGAQMSLSLAGHPPLLHYSKRTDEVCEHPTLDLPLGILPEQTFNSTTLTFESGDVLILLTDGMTEVFNKEGKEMGIEPVKAMIKKSASLPLPDMFTALRQSALSFGNQDDDQTLLIVRCL